MNYLEYQKRVFISHIALIKIHSLLFITLLNVDELYFSLVVSVVAGFIILPIIFANPLIMVMIYGLRKKEYKYEYLFIATFLTAIILAFILMFVFFGFGEDPYTSGVSYINSSIILLTLTLLSPNLYIIYYKLIKKRYESSNTLYKDLFIATIFIIFFMPINFYIIVSTISYIVD